MSAGVAPRPSGFSLIELMVALALLAVLALLVLPLAQVQAQRSKEAELRRALDDIRSAIDAYHDAALRGAIALPVNANPYPPSLQVLADGVTDAQHAGGRRLYFLRRVPRDPFHADPRTPAAETWALRSYDSPPDAPAPGSDVYDVASRSAGIGLNGVPYKQW